MACAPVCAADRSWPLPPVAICLRNSRTCWRASIVASWQSDHSLNWQQRPGSASARCAVSFELHLGASPKQVEQTRRLLLAKRLLTETGLPITDIAFAAGFASIRRFNDAWLNAYGLAPRTLRQQEQHDDAPEHMGSQPRGATLTLQLPYRPPYDVAAMLAFLPAAGNPGAGAGGWRHV